MPRARALLLAVLAGGAIGVHLKPPLRAQGGAGHPFARGDANADGESNISDAVYILGCQFLGAECAACADAADLNDDGLIDVTDPVFLLTFLFLGGDGPPSPGDVCGPDPTADGLDCRSFPRCAASNPDAIPTARGDLLVMPIEHATLVLRWDQKTIYVDPVGGAVRFAGLPAPNLIVVTHTHSDHLDRPTILGVATARTVLVAPQAVSDVLARTGGVGQAQQKVLSNGQKVTVEGMEVEAVPMYNLTADRLRYHSKGQGNGYVLDLAGTRVYVSGDTEDIPEMRALQDIDLAFVCMNLPFTMTPQQAASAVLEFKPVVVYPYHYRGQDQRKLKSLVEAQSRQIEVRIREWYPSR